MTRIYRLADVGTFTDNEIISQIRDINKVFAYISRHPELVKTESNQMYLSGKGFCKYFAFKAKFLLKRIYEIKREAKRRNIKINSRKIFEQYVRMDDKFKGN